MSADNWRAALETWRKSNPITMPADLRQLREEFVRRFPPGQITDLTLEQYALGHPKSRDSFCYWLEWRTGKLGSARGGTSAKWGVWWDAEAGVWRNNEGFAGPEDALHQMTGGLSKLIAAVDQQQFDDLDAFGAAELGPNRYMLRQKPLYLYFPDDFMPISSLKHLEHFLRLFGLTPDGDQLAMNRQLLLHMRGLPEFAGFDSGQMMRFLYDSLSPKQGKTAAVGNPELLEERFGPLRAIRRNQLYVDQERSYKDNLLAALGKVLADEVLAAPDFAARLQAACAEQKEGTGESLALVILCRLRPFLEVRRTRPRTVHVPVALGRVGSCRRTHGRVQADRRCWVSRIYLRPPQAALFGAAYRISCCPLPRTLYDLPCGAHRQGMQGLGDSPACGRRKLVF